MPADDAARVADVRGWLSKAAIDLRAGRHASAADPPLLDDAVFHAQQAAEKSLKAFLAWHDRPFRKTHDLAELGRACVELDVSLEPLLREAASLTEYAWKFRYPGAPDEPSRNETETALDTAGEVWSAIIERLPQECRPGT
ncbi:MAG: HEPN domain-containing protein [Acidobacteria bacterium]|nr:HEPN domain-containing protein [Acidobacteriota bacterium]